MSLPSDAIVQDRVARGCGNVHVELTPYLADYLDRLSDWTHSSAGRDPDEFHAFQTLFQAGYADMATRDASPQFWFRRKHES